MTRPFTSDDELAAIAHGVMDLSLPKPRWTHRAHFAAALWFLARRPDINLPRVMPGLIRAYNESTGVANTDTGGYHETITLASLRAASSFLAERCDEPLFARLQCADGGGFRQIRLAARILDEGTAVLHRGPPRIGSSRISGHCRSE